MRLDPHIRFLAIEGVIGVGKTTLAELLANELEATFLQEEFAENPFLEKFYDDKEAYAFQTQLFFLLSRHRQFQDTFIQHDLFRNLVVSDYTLDKDRIFAMQNLSEAEMSMYDTVSAALERDRVKPDYVVYLQASVPTLMHRIKKRDRPMERTIEGNYLRDLVDRYNHHFLHYEDCPVLIVNTDHIDFVENEKHLQQVLQAIASCPAQTTYYVPEGH